MEQLRKEAYASNTPIIVPSKAVDLKHEHEMVVEWKFNHTLLQDKLMSCKHIKHIGSFADHISDVISANVFNMDGSGFSKMWIVGHIVIEVLSLMSTINVIMM
jgi:hypothetical protein